MEKKVRPYKIFDRRSRKKIGVVVSSLEELISKAQEKFGFRCSVKVLLENDGTHVEDESYFATREPDTCFLILKHDEDWYTTPTSSESLSESKANRNVLKELEPKNDDVAIPTENVIANELIKPSEITANQPFRFSGSLVKTGLFEDQATKPSKLDFSSLPEILKEEILSRILKFLTAKDRNSVRLTCKLWNNICNNDSEVVKNEKLVFWPIDSISSITSCLEKSQRKILNVEFNINELNKIPEETWKLCGNKIRSVKWNESSPMVWSSGQCMSYDEEIDIWTDFGNRKAATVLNMIYYCSELEYFHRSIEYHYYGEVLSKKVEKSLLRAKTVRPRFKGLSDSLSFFHIFHGKVFKIFPKMTDVTVANNYQTDEGLSLDFSKLPGSVKKLNIGGGLSCRSNCLKTMNGDVKLEELVFFVHGETEIFRSLSPFLAQQNKLKVLRLIISDIYVEHEMIGSGLFSTIEEVESYKAKLTALILKNCRDLKELDIVFEWAKESDIGTQYDSEITQVFTNCIPKLKSFSSSYFNWSVWMPPVLPESSNLQSLQLPEDLSSSLRLLKSTMCSKLQYVDLPKCSIDLLKTLVLYQLNLKSMRIDQLSEAKSVPNKKTRNQYLGNMRKTPRFTFQKLEHLEIHDGTYSMLLVFNEFHFPSLKHFVISDNVEVFKHHVPILKLLERLPQRVPDLEVLHISLNVDEWINKSQDLAFVAQMSCLQVIGFGSKGISFHQQISPEEVKKTFEMCLSLQVLMHDDTVFFYERKSKEMVGRGLSMKRRHEKTFMSFKQDKCCQLLPRRRNDEKSY